MMMNMDRDLRKEVQGVKGFLEANAGSVDIAESTSNQHFSALAAAGLYGAFAPTSVGGLELDLATLCAIVEDLASACLTTTFVWIQHFRLLACVLDPATPENLRELRPLVVSGQLKGGVALSGLLPGPPRLRATETSD